MRKIFANYFYGKGLTSRIYKELEKYNKTQLIQFENGQMIRTDIFQKNNANDQQVYEKLLSIISH
jgi:hypothetical protein